MFVVPLVLILFGITLIAICGSYFAELIGEYLRGDPFSVIERKARAAIEAADLGWLAIVSGPLCGLFLGSIVLPVEHWLKRVRVAAPLPYGKTVLLTIGVGSVVGVIVAGAFWTTSAILGKARDRGKESGTICDPDFDGPV